MRHPLHLVCLHTHRLLHVLPRLIAPPRVWVVMNSRMTGKLIGAAEPFRASLEPTSVRFLPRMCPNVSCLMFESMEGFFTEGTLVWAWKVRSLFSPLLRRSGHVGQQLLRGDLGLLVQLKIQEFISRLFLQRLHRRLWIQQIIKI